MYKRSKWISDTRFICVLVTVSLFEVFSKSLKIIKISFKSSYLVFTSSSSLGIGFGKRRVRRLYLDFGVEIFWAIDALGVGRAVGPGVLTIDGGKRFVGVDEPNATAVLLTCTIRLAFDELVNAKNSEAIIDICLYCGQIHTWSGSKKRLNTFKGWWFRCCINCIIWWSYLYYWRINSNSSKWGSIKWCIPLNGSINWWMWFLLNRWRCWRIDSLLFRSTTNTWWFRFDFWIGFINLNKESFF
jgi:hypothetical protein